MLACTICMCFGKWHASVSAWVVPAAMQCCAPRQANMVLRLRQCCECALAVYSCLAAMLRAVTHTTFAQLVAALRSSRHMPMCSSVRHDLTNSRHHEVLQCAHGDTTSTLPALLAPFELLHQPLQQQVLSVVARLPLGVGACDAMSVPRHASCRQHARPACILDLLLSQLGKEASLDNDRLGWQLTLAQHLVDAMLCDIDDGCLLALVRCLLTRFLANERPQLVEVDDGAMVLVLVQVEVPHANLAKVARVVLVEQNAMMMLATSITTTRRMLSMLANTAMTGGDVPPLLAVRAEAGRHDEHNLPRRERATSRRLALKRVAVS